MRGMDASDRSSAYIYAEFFAMLAKDPTDQHKAWARELWKSTREYDFSPDQMGADRALKTLGLAVDGVDEDGYKRALYLASDGKGYE